MSIRLDGKQIAAEIRGSLKEKVDEIRKTVPDFSPGLAIVQESFLIFNRRNFRHIGSRPRWCREPNTDDLDNWNESIDFQVWYHS